MLFFSLFFFFHIYIYICIYIYSDTAPKSNEQEPPMVARAQDHTDYAINVLNVAM